MARKFTESKLVIASHNPGKVREIAALLAPFATEVISAAALNLPEPEETGSTFLENAAIKALASAQGDANGANLPALADDSGLVVPALDGAPGLYSARWAGPDKDFGRAMARVKQELANRDPAAYFVAALALAWPDGHVEQFEGRVYGQLVWPGRGTNGFGYDPVFVADGYDMTFGEMDPDHKHAISHRAKAFEQLIDACF